MRGADCLGDRSEVEASLYFCTCRIFYKLLNIAILIENLIVVFKLQTQPLHDLDNSHDDALTIVLSLSLLYRQKTNKVHQV